MTYRIQPSDIRRREAVPLVKQTKQGPQLMCPYCVPSHPIAINVDSPCGTTIKVTALQTIVPSRISRMAGLTCIKCHKVGHGDMVPYHQGFVHVEDCTPGIKLMTLPPKISRMAGLVAKLPEKIRTMIEKRTGKTQSVELIDPIGKEIGKTLGYVFVKGKNG